MPYFQPIFDELLYFSIFFREKNPSFRKLPKNSSILKILGKKLLNIFAGILFYENHYSVNVVCQLCCFVPPFPLLLLHFETLRADFSQFSGIFPAPALRAKNFLNHSNISSILPKCRRKKTIITLYGEIPHKQWSSQANHRTLFPSFSRTKGILMSTHTPPGGGGGSRKNSEISSKTRK